MDNLDEIKKAIISLDVDNDEHWLGSGLPHLDAVSKRLGYSVTRKQVSTAYPTYDRVMAKQLLEKPQDQGNGTPPPPPPVAGDEGTTQGDTGGDVKHSPLFVADDEDQAETSDDSDEETPVKLIERAITLASSQRFSRNQPLQQYLRGFGIVQYEIEAHQKRLDIRNKIRTDRNDK